MSKLFLVGLVQNSSPKWLLQHLLLIPWPPSSPGLQMTEACFLGGGYPAHFSTTGVSPSTSGNAHDWMNPLTHFIKS